MLIETIIIMILISIHPFAFKKIFFLIVAIICLSSVPCFADSLFLTVHSTPYDGQMSRIQPVLASSNTDSSAHVSIALVNQWMADLRSIPYGFSQQWKTPAEVESGSPADCKGKAVALYQRMLAHGATNVRLVIGKRTATSRATHAWLVWQTNNGSYMLDPTFNWMASRSEELRRSSYAPLYAYAGNRKYRAASSTLFAKN